MAKERRFDCVNIRTACKLGLHPELYCNGTCKLYKHDPQTVMCAKCTQATAGIPAAEHDKALARIAELENDVTSLKASADQVPELEHELELANEEKEKMAKKIEELKAPKAKKPKPSKR